MVEKYGAAPMVDDSFGYEHSLIPDSLCIYSHYPIVKKYTHPEVIGTFKFRGVEIDMDGSSGVHFMETT